MPLYAMSLPSGGAILLHHDRVMVMGERDETLQDACPGVREPLVTEGFREPRVAARHHGKRG